MKALVLVLFVFSVPVLSQAYTCEVSEKVLDVRACTVCDKKDGNNDCVHEVESTCGYEVSLATEVKQSVNASQSQLFLGQRGVKASFVLSGSETGYTARLTSEKTGEESSFSSNHVLDFKKDQVSLFLKLAQKATRRGDTIGFALTCK